jgi:phosphatidylglycerol:prolipoprotein diacylglycerol transferase
MIPVGSHPALHPVFEAAGYVAGFLVFRRLRAAQGDVVDASQRWSVLAGAAVGALAGSRVLGIAEQWPTVMAAWHRGRFLALIMTPGGKTIAGGLLGAWIGVEMVKRFSGIRNRTGDLFALPLCVGIAIGRVGCLLAGLADDTYGKPTGVPAPWWAVDLGDGVGRYPVQIFEIVFLVLVGLVVSLKVTLPVGVRFRIFLGSYLAWRVVIDFLKPQALIDGMNLIQWCCLAGLAVLVFDALRMRREGYAALRA